MVKPFGWIVAVGEVARLPLTSGLAWPWLPPPLVSKGKDKEFVSDPGNRRTGLRWKGRREPAEDQQCGNWTRAWTRIAEVKGLGSLVSEGRNHVTLKLGWLWLIHGNPPSPGRKGTCRFDSVPPFILFCAPYTMTKACYGSGSPGTCPICIPLWTWLHSIGWTAIPPADGGAVHRIQSTIGPVEFHVYSAISGIGCQYCRSTVLWLLNKQKTSS